MTAKKPGAKKRAKRAQRARYDRTEPTSFVISKATLALVDQRAALHNVSRSWFVEVALTHGIAAADAYFALVGGGG